MATAEAATGPRYAPDDPTLPKPWMGLIDGSTGVLYYWNPETNVTQYEKPAPLPPPLPLGPHPATATPKLAAIPGAQPNGVVHQDGQQVAQATYQQGQQQVNQYAHQQYGHLMGQQTSSYSQQQSLQMPHGGHQQGSQLGQGTQPHGQVSVSQQHMMQHSSQQMMQHPNQQMTTASSQQAGQQIPNQLGQQAPPSQNSQMPQAQGHQYSHQQQMQYMGYQQSSLPQGQQSSQQQTPHSAHGQGSANQQSAYPPREEHDFQHRNQSGFSPSQYQQAGASSVQTLPTGTSSVQMPLRAVHHTQPQQFGGSMGNMQQSSFTHMQQSSFTHMQQSGTDSVHHQQGSRFQDQMDPAMIHSQQPNMPPSLRSHENNFQGRIGNDYYMNGNNEGPTGTQQPKLSAIPMTIPRSQQDMGISGVPFQNAAPGQGMHNTYGHATGGPPFSNNALVKPSYAGPTGVSGLSPVQAYLQQHEVTATGDNVPAPFMTFEDTGFPPEILRDVRYLLRRWSICRTLHCYWHIYTCNNYSHFWRLQNELLEPFLCIF